MMNHREGTCSLCGAEGLVSAASADGAALCGACLWEGQVWAATQAHAAKEKPKEHAKPEGKVKK